MPLLGPYYNRVFQKLIMGQEFGISVSSNLSIDATLSPTGRDVSLNMLPLLFGEGFKFCSYGYFCIIVFSTFSSLSFFLLPLLFFFSFNKRMSKHTYVWFFCTSFFLCCF